MLDLHGIWARQKANALFKQVAGNKVWLRACRAGPSENATESDADGLGKRVLEGEYWCKKQKDANDREIGSQLHRACEGCESLSYLLWGLDWALS